MIDATAETARRAPSAQARIELPVTRDGLAAAVASAVRRASGRSPIGPATCSASGVPASTGAQIGAMLRPIADAARHERRSSRARGDLLVGTISAAPASRRFSAADRRRRPARPTPTGPLAPGDAVGVSLLGGDAEMGATGTVTHIDGDARLRVRPSVLQLRARPQFPMTRAYVYASLPSLMSSFKIATMGDVIGTVQQDRATAIAGTLGKGPAGPMPVNLHARLAKRAARRTFHYAVVDDQLFTPLLDLRRAVQHARQLRAAVRRGHLHRQGHARVRGAHRPDTTKTSSPATMPSLGASAYVAGPLTMLLANDLEPVTVKSIDLTVDVRGRAAQRDDRARVARRRAAARRADGAAEGADAQLPRRQKRSRRFRSTFRPTRRDSCR